VRGFFRGLSMLKIKNWSEFQHFRDRDPIWIKLYRKLLDDINWHELDGNDAKVLVMLWLLASEKNGELPPIKVIAYRLRLPEKSIKSTVSRLFHFLYHDDINTIHDNNVISDCYQGDSPHALAREEKRREETEGFDVFWQTYPKKVGKPAAEKAFKAAKINGHLAEVIGDIEAKSASEAWKKDGGQYIPNPATYLNQRRWEDGVTESPSMFAGAI
jgi:hypothetical protein